MAGDPAANEQFSPFVRAASLGYVVNHVARLFARALDKRLARHGVALGQFAPLLILWEQEGITQSEVARRLDIEQPTMANTLRRMERDGLVVTSPDPHHRRQVLIHLSDKGRSLRAALTAEARNVNALAGAALDASELKALLGSLERMGAALARDAD